MKIAFNPSTVAALTTPPNNKDITFDLRGQNIFARGVKFYGTDTNTWRPVVDNLTSNSTTSSLSANQGRVLAGLINGKSDSDHNHDGRYVRAFGTSHDNIDSDWGQSFKTFDPIPLGTPPEQNANISLLSIGENFNRRKQLAFNWNNDNIYYRRHIDGYFTNWRRLAFANEIPSSLKNPYALTISLNGTSQGPYDGSAAKNINITPGSIGAATSDHNHDGRYVYNYGGTQMDGASVDKNALGMTTNSGITGEWWHILQAAWNGEYRWNSQIAFPTQNRNGMYYRSGLDDNTAWGSWVKLLDANNYSSVLDTRYITDITTSVNKLTFTKNGSSIAKDIIVNNVQSQGQLTNIADQDNTTKADSGLYIYDSYYQIIGTNHFSSVLSIHTGGTIQIAGNWGDDETRNLYWRSQSDRDVTDYPWKSWRTILDSENYSSTLDSRYYTESEVNSLLSNKLNTSDFNWTNLPGKIVAGNEFNIVNAGFKESMWFNYLPINDRSKTATISSYHFGNGAKGYTHIIASGFIKNGSNSSYVLLGDGGHQTISSLSVNYANSSGSASHLEGGGIPGWGTLTAANGFTNVSSWDYGSRGAYGLCGKSGILCMQLDGYFYQNEGQYRVLDTSDVAGLKGDLTIHQYLSATDATWWPLIWGGSSHANTSDSTGAVYKSHDVLSWQTSSQTLYATRLATTSIDLQNNRGIFQVISGGTSPFKGIKLPDLQSNGIGMFSKIGSGDGTDEGGIIISADTSVIYNSFDTGWGLTIRDKDRGQMDISGDGTIAFGVRQDYRVYSLGGFEKSGSNNSYVLLGGGEHKLESALNVSNADTVDYYHADSLFRDLGWWGSNDTHDANDISGNGAVFAYAQHSNVPDTGVLVTFRGASDGYRWQMSKSYYSKSLHIRQRNGDNGTWSNWLRLLDESDLTWDNIIGKPNTFTPAAHTHTVFSNNLMIKGTNGISDSASIHLGIGDSDTGFKWISDGVCQIYANNVAIGQWTSGGMNWFANPTVNGNKVWNAGNDGSGSGLDADMLDGYHENSFLRYRGATSTDQEATLWDQIGIKSYGDALPDGLTNIYNYGSVISLPGLGSRFEIYASHLSSAGNGLYYRSGWNNDKRPWVKFIDSSNIGSQSVNYANSAGNADTVDGYHATDGRTFNGDINWGSWSDAWSDGTNKHPWYGFDHRYPNTGAYSTTITDYFGMTIKTANTLRLDFSNLLLNGTSIYDINVASATKVIVNQHTSNDINYPLVWSNQSNDSSVTENQLFKSWADLYYNPKNKILAVGGYFRGPWARFTDQNGALVIGDNISARISAIGDQIIFNTGSALRFGETAWDWNQWAGLKYNHSAKTIYLGIADNSVFNANSVQSNGTLKFPGISNIDLDNGAQIRREGSSQAWVNGRNGALLRETSVAGYHALWSLKTTNGSWDFGEYNAGGGWNNVPVLSYVTDSNYNSGNNTATYQIRFPLDSGTVALTKNIPSSLPANGGNADTLGGTSLGGLFTAFGNNAHNITATIGGVTKSFLVNYAADADKVDGVHVKWAGELTSTAHLVAWEADGSALRDINPANVTVGNSDKVDGYHASQLAKAWSGSGTMNQVAQNNGNYFGMITGKGTEGFPNDDGGWTHVFQASYNNNSGGDGNTGNFWVTQIANQAGTTSPWIRSRRGGSDISTGWTDWVRIMTKNDVDNYYWADIKVSTSSNTQTTPTFNTAYATNWFRARGNSGFYFQDHAGGFYMEDNTWIKTWSSKALYVNNTIRSTNYQAMYGSTSVSAAKLESAAALIYGTDTSSQSINTYLRGTTVTLQVKKGTSINYNALQLTDTYIYCNNYCDMKQGASVSGGNLTVSTKAYIAQKGLLFRANDQIWYQQPVCIACGYMYDGPSNPGMVGSRERIQKVLCNQAASVTLIDGNGKYRVIFTNIIANKFNREKMSLQLTGCPHGIDSRGVSDARGTVSSYGNALSIEVYTSDDNSLNPTSFYFALWTWE